MSLKWERLHSSTEENLPPLLFNYTSTSERYDLYITDLTHLWSEQLNRKAILKRADETNTTIDPSEDPDQFKVLLQKIEEALRGSPESFVALNNGRDGDSLELVLLAKLPAPLKPLKWSLYLSKEPHSSSTRYLLFPLLREAVGFEARERALLDHIKQKDWVLAKLFDKVETMGIDLSTVFPGTSGLRAGRKGTNLAQAGKHIKGIAPFDEQAWFDEVSKSSPDSGLAGKLVAQISGADRLNVESLGPAQDKWWNSLPRQGTTPAIAMEESEEDQEDRQPEAPRDEMDIDTDAGQETDDEFERQETPPRLKQQKDTDESPPRVEKEHQKQARKSPSPPQRPPAKTSKPMGVIGGKKPPKQPSPKPDMETPTPSPEPEKEAADQETASEQDSHKDISPPSQIPTRQKDPEPEPRPSKPKKTGGLGVIGGKKKEKPPSQSPPPAPSAESTGSEEAAPAASPPKKSPGKLGTIGGKKKEQSAAGEPSPQKRPAKLGVIGGKAAKRKEPHPPPAEQPSSLTTAEDREVKSPSRSPAKVKSKRTSPKREPEPEPEPEKEETEQERADRKREELKRQLEAKSKAPVKKKRKF